MKDVCIDCGHEIIDNSQNCIDCECDDHDTAVETVDEE